MAGWPNLRDLGQCPDGLEKMVFPPFLLHFCWSRPAEYFQKSPRRDTSISGVFGVQRGRGGEREGGSPTPLNRGQKTQNVRSH